MRKNFHKNTYSVLTVDDDENILSALDGWIKDEGYISYTAKNAHEALDIIKTHTIDIALLDFLMPVINGFDLIKMIRKDYTFPIIIISSDADDMNQAVGYNHGADDYIPKPFDKIKLINVLKAQLRRSYMFCFNSTIPICNGTIRFNVENDCITDGKNTVIFSKNESIVLRTLISNIGNPVTIDELCEKLSTACGKTISQGTLINTVSRIKSKIAQKNINNNFIESIRGLGYFIS